MFRGTDYVKGQIFVHIFMPNGDYMCCVQYLQTFFTACTVGEYHLDVAQFELGNIQSSDVFRSIARAKLFDELRKSIEISQRYWKSIEGFTMSN